MLYRSSSAIIGTDVEPSPDNHRQSNSYGESEHFFGAYDDCCAQRFSEPDGDDANFSALILCTDHEHLRSIRGAEHLKQPDSLADAIVRTDVEPCTNRYDDSERFFGANEDAGAERFEEPDSLSFPFI